MYKVIFSVDKELGYRENTIKDTPKRVYDSLVGQKVKSERIEYIFHEALYRLGTVAYLTYQIHHLDKKLYEDGLHIQEDFVKLYKNQSKKIDVRNHVGYLLEKEFNDISFEEILDRYKEFQMPERKNGKIKLVFFNIRGTFGTLKILCLIKQHIFAKIKRYHLATNLSYTIIGAIKICIDTNETYRYAEFLSCIDGQHISTDMYNILRKRKFLYINSEELKETIKEIENIISSESKRVGKLILENEEMKKKYEARQLLIDVLIRAEICTKIYDEYYFPLNFFESEQQLARYVGFVLEIIRDYYSSYKIKQTELLDSFFIVPSINSDGDQFEIINAKINSYKKKPIAEIIEKKMSELLNPRLKKETQRTIENRFKRKICDVFNLIDENILITAEINSKKNNTAVNEILDEIRSIR